MTNLEARQILIEYNTWRRLPKTIISPHTFAQCTKAIDLAVVALGDSENLDLSIAYLDGYAKGQRSKSPIPQAIRDAALNWKCDGFDKLYGSVELALVKSFCEITYLTHQLLGWHGEAAKNQARTFMLFVAEALES
jgi:hypothetical protein